MPSRKSDTTETSQNESHRSSLRRFSSIASFQALNPFSRRRSTNNDSTIVSSTSTLSLSSSTNATSKPSQKVASSSSSGQFPSDDDLTALPVPPVPGLSTSRRSSYICLPDDPIGGMPRSRTFSNLPLPTRARRNPAMPVSKSHSRLPSAAMPSTRIPTPPVSTRKHSVSKLAIGTEPKQPVIRNRVKRSDTEPLLPFNSQSAHIGRSTAFKENISMSPMKPLPRQSSLANRSGNVEMHGWACSGDRSDYPSVDDLLKANPRHASQLSQSSPICRSSYIRTRERVPTPGMAPKGQPVQRWNSQPILNNITNRRHSRHGEIKERRLMSEVQPVQPPPPKTPLSSELLSSVNPKTSSVSSRWRQGSQQSPSLMKPLPSKPRDLSPVRNPQQVAAAETTSYWSGRFSSLIDRFRNEELVALLNGPRRDSDKMHTPEANLRRMRRALEHLHGLCVTSEARESFVVFQLQLAAMQNNAELGKPVTSAGTASGEKLIVLSRKGEELEGAGTGVSEQRKVSFMDRLLGRNRRSLVL